MLLFVKFITVPQMKYIKEFEYVFNTLIVCIYRNYLRVELSLVAPPASHNSPNYAVKNMSCPHLLSFPCSPDNACCPPDRQEKCACLLASPPRPVSHGVLLHMECLPVSHEVLAVTSTPSMCSYLESLVSPMECFTHCMMSMTHVMDVSRDFGHLQ